VLYVEPIRTAGAHTLLLGDQISSSGMLASWAMVETRAVATGAGNVLLSSIIVPLGLAGISLLRTSRFGLDQSERDKPDYHVESLRLTVRPQV